MEPYTEHGVSEPASRPALDRLLADSRSGRFDAVVTWRADQSARPASRENAGILKIACGRGESGEVGGRDGGRESTRARSSRGHAGWPPRVSRRAKPPRDARDDGGECYPLRVSLSQTDIPEATHLETVRVLVDGVRDGLATTTALGSLTGLSERHVKYYLHAARVLGLVSLDGDKPKVTAAGSRLAGTSKSSREEAMELARAVLACPAIVQVAGDLISNGHSRLELGARIRTLSGLAEATAEKRAGTIIAWREYVQKWAASAPVVPIAPPAAKTSTPVPPARTDASALLAPAALACLAEQVSKGKIGLFTGAGFSMDAKDHSGISLPSGAGLAREIWSIVYPNEPYEEDSSLADLFARGAKSHPKQL